MLLTVIVPVFNEEARILEALELISACDFIDQVIVVNDGSDDGTKIIIEKFIEKNSKFNLVSHDKNYGKGKAVRTALEFCSSQFIAIQDADLEYNPQELKKLLNPLNSNLADVVYGSRFIGSEPRSVHLYWHSVANKLLTSFTNIFTNLNLTDMEVCQKMFRNSLVQRIELKENGFGIEPELTVKFARAGARFYEVGISYKGRTYTEGKKIKWIDAFVAIYCIVVYSLLPKKYWMDR